MAVCIDHVVTSGTFQLDGGTWAVDNNVWLIGDESKVVVIDAAHDATPIAEAIGRRYVTGIVCTHGHSDHINAAPELSRRCGGRVLLHPADEPLWRMTHPSQRWAGDLVDGGRLRVGQTMIEVMHTPGHAPGAVCLYVPDLGALFSGDTLFAGGPGATGRSFSDFPTIIESISKRLLDLPPQTVVYPGHGPTTTIGDEAPHLKEWIARGH